VLRFPRLADRLHLLIARAVRELQDPGRSRVVREQCDIARHSRRGWRLDKPSLEQPNDAIIALCMALEAMENQPEPVQLLGWL
jgi:hypothetical protein